MNGNMPYEHEKRAAHEKPKRRTSSLGHVELADELSRDGLGKRYLESDSAEYDMGDAQGEHGPRDYV